MTESTDELKVIISWSKDRSKAVATALRAWLGDVTSRVEPWMSDHDIEGGVRWSEDLALQLEQSGFGIVCLTPENLKSEWVLFEAGAISKAHRARVIPYLFDLTPTQVHPPLSVFQCLTADREGTRKLLTSLNSQIPGGGLEDRLTENLFAAQWPKLKAELEEIPPTPEVEQPRKVEDMVPEILDVVRSIQRRVDPDPARQLAKRWAEIQSMDPVSRRAIFRRAAELQESPIERVMREIEGLRDRPRPTDEEETETPPQA